MKKTTLSLVMATLCLIFTATAQQTRYLKGKVVTSDQQPLPGATVKYNKATVLTNQQGLFEINTGALEGMITVSYTGYKSKEIHFKDISQSLLIILEEDQSALKEVEINAGYYTVKDRERTGSISRVTAKTIEQQPVNNLLQAMQGRIPGVEIIQQTGVPGGGFQVRIRGQNSMVNGNDPLYIVNGITILPASLSSSALSSFNLVSANPLSFINPTDIESIEVLKDADATAIYGSRGANGVVLITTKTGKAGKLKLDANFNYGAGKVSSKIDLLNTQEYIEMRKEAFKNDNANPGAADNDINGAWDQNRYTDWQKELIGGTANTYTGRVSISGGNENTTFLLSGNYYKETTVYPGNANYQKKSSIININHITPDQKFKVQFSGGYTIEDSTLPANDLTANILLPPNAPALLLPNGEINWENGTFPNNPMVQMKRPFQSNTGTFTANTNLTYSILPHLELNTTIGFTRMQRDELVIIPLASLNPSGTLTANNRTANYADNWRQTFNVEPRLSYSVKFGPGTLSALAGATIQENKSHLQTIEGTGYVSDDLMPNIAAAATVNVRDASNLTYRYLSAYTRINYSLRNKYFLNLTGRMDGSSRFGVENIYANFGAIGAVWIFSEEHFIAKNLSFLSFGKLRTSYGTSGNDQIGDYNYLELWSPTSTYQTQVSLRPTRLFNPNYAWETNRKAEVSLELGFLKDRLHLTVSHFRNRSSNQLVNYALAPSTGFTAINRNLAATIQNSGWEVDINATVFQKQGLRWSAALNFSLPRNKLLAFPNLDKSSYAANYIIGESLNIAKTVQFTGVNPATGLYTFYDLDGNGQINRNDSNGFITLGQKYSGGVQNTIEYKNFEFDFLFQFVKQKGRNYMTGVPAPGLAYNQSREVLNRWQQSGDITGIQKYGVSSVNTPYSHLRNFSGLPISDASFIRLKNVALSYKLPSDRLKSVGIGQAKIYIQAQNLFTFTDFIGLDPESTRFTSLPSLRVITAGLQVNF
jgi:TonB-linked SusC/RagA family outer membrane protein